MSCFFSRAWLRALNSRDILSASCFGEVQKNQGREQGVSSMLHGTGTRMFVVTDERTRDTNVIVWLREIANHFPFIYLGVFFSLIRISSEMPLDQIGPRTFFNAYDFFSRI